MIIRRDVGAIKVEIVMTERELYEAYEEQRMLFDIQDCENYFDNNYYEEEWYPLNADVRNALIEDAANELRRNLDKYDMHFEYAIGEAFRTAIPRYILNP